MGKQVRDEVVNQINNLDIKYYSIIVDSPPNMAHVDQLVIVIRYCYNGKPLVWEGVTECFNKASKKLQTPGFNVFEGYLLLASLLSFVKELRENSADRIARCESVAKGLCEYIFSNYFDVSKRIVTKKFADGTSDRASIKGADKFRIEILNQVYECLIIQLSKRMDPYEQIAKRFKFLSELMNNSELDEDSIELIISDYKDDIHHKLINELSVQRVSTPQEIPEHRRKHTIKNAMHRVTVIESRSAHARLMIFRDVSVKFMIGIDSQYFLMPTSSITPGLIRYRKRSEINRLPSSNQLGEKMLALGKATLRFWGGLNQRIN
ncbi:Hypothetical predicted protein [Octopus vulgaris]|uniref:DUF4371 domain-containing protein n=1 Tax=Octopus vulgaris TaxID=6645 RepID=A0AA36B4W5_OCTVU|nr:Hypothetical predicted protein [Octopus vulgaris]